MLAMWENLFKNKDTSQEIKDLLKSTHLFQDLSSRELKLLEGMVHVRHFRVGEAIFRQGEVGVGMYIVSYGSIEICIEDGSLSATDDESQITRVTRLKSGDFFGELSLVEDNSRRGASAIAQEEAALIGFFKPDLFEIIERNPSMGAKILFRLSEALGRRLKATTSKVTELKKEIGKLTVLDDK